MEKDVPTLTSFEEKAVSDFIPLYKRYKQGNKQAKPAHLLIDQIVWDALQWKLDGDDSILKTFSTDDTEVVTSAGI